MSEKFIAHAPIELSMNVFIIHEETEQAGKAEIGLGFMKFHSPQHLANRLATFEREELPNVAPGFRLMTKEETFNYAMHEKTGTKERWATPGGYEWDEFPYSKE